MIPLLHDFQNETVLVFGGGTVGARKARRFAREAEVIVVSPTFTDAAFGDAEKVRAKPKPDDIAGWLDRVSPALAVAATDDPAVNGAIEGEALDRGLLVNRADVPGGRPAGSVVVPATVRDEPVVVAVSTGGTSPAVAKYLRERLETVIDGAGAMAELAADVRDDLRNQEVHPEHRRAAVTAVVKSNRVWKALGEGHAKSRQVAEEVTADVLGETN